LSIQARIDIKTDPTYTDIEAPKGSYEEKRVALWRILAKAVELAAVTPATDTKKNHHCLSTQGRINVETAPVCTGIEARKVNHEEN
jgi:hypothetical protein